MNYTLFTDSPERKSVLLMCHKSTPVLNAYLIWTSNDPLSTATWQCQNGYMYSDGSSVRTSICLDGGLWSDVGDCLGNYD